MYGMPYIIPNVLSPSPSPPPRVNSLKVQEASAPASPTPKVILAPRAP